MNYYMKRGGTQLNNKEKGVATVEFALAAMLFLTVFFAIIDFSYLFWGNLSMQHAVREGARYAVTGQSGLDPNPQGTAQDRCDAAVVAIRNQSMGFFERASAVVAFSTVTAGDPPTITPVPGNSCAAAGQIILITVNCTLPLLTPFLQPFFSGANYAFSVSATMKNEDF